MRGAKDAATVAAVIVIALTAKAFAAMQPEKPTQPAAPAQHAAYVQKTVRGGCLTPAAAAAKTAVALAGAPQRTGE